MPLVSTRTIYERARRGGYAVGGFDAEHMEMVKAIVEAAEELRAPVIVMLWEGDIEVAGDGYLEALVKHAASKTTVPIAMQVDHATSVESCLRCVLNGHKSVMIDGSHLPFAENVALTKKVVDICHLMDVMVEGEVGTIPRTFENDGPYSEDKRLTEPEEAAEFVRLTGTDALAVSIGTESGLYKEEPKIDYERLKAIRNLTDAYLILHGGSGIPADQIRHVVQEGIVGIRFATELRIAFYDTMEQKRRELGHDFPDSRKMLRPAREAAKAIIKDKMYQMGCVGQACTDGLCPPILKKDASKLTHTHSVSEIDHIVDLVIQHLQNNGVQM
jgi:fructose-bisphosphate aldolase, class II